MNGKFPAAVGVPEIVALGEPNVRVSPAGSVPLMIEKVKGTAAPVAVTVCEYVYPVRPAGNDVVEKLTCPKPAQLKTNRATATNVSFI